MDLLCTVQYKTNFYNKINYFFECLSLTCKVFSDAGLQISSTIHAGSAFMRIATPHLCT